VNRTYALQVIAEERLVMSNRGENDNVAVIDASDIPLPVGKWPLELLVSRDGAASYFQNAGFARSEGEILMATYVDLKTGQQIHVYND
jgi:hypothetical protein